MTKKTRRQFLSASVAATGAVAGVIATAGTAAVQALQSGESADNLDTERLVKTLRQQDVYLPQEKLSPEMTRS